MQPRLLRGLAPCLTILALVSLALVPDAGAQTDYKLTILHTSENHGAWEPWAPVANGPLVGGIARRATLVKQIRAQANHTLLVDSGDISQRALLFAKYKGQEGRDLYNAVGYDAVTLGNHEFDFGAKSLLDTFVTGAKFDILAANTDFAIEPGLTGKVKPYVVKTVGGEHVGLIGVMHEHLGTSVSPLWKVFSTDPVEAVRSSVKDLEAQGVNKIIVLSHTGYNVRRSGLPFDDMGIAQAVDGVDVIVGGHDETLLADAAKLPAFAPRPAGPNPSVVKSPNGNPVLIVNNWKWGALVGRLDVTFDSRGVPIQWQGDTIVVDDKITEDPTVASLYQTLSTAVEEIRREVVGKIPADLPGERVDVRAREAALGNLVADAMLEITAPDKTVIAMMNGGGIRISLKAGNVTVGDVLTVLPFGNTIYTLDLKGTDLLQALENGVSGVSAENPGASGGKFAQVAGLRLTADLSRPIGQRITEVLIGNARDGFKPIDLHATYRVATNDFMASGGDGYAAFTRGANIKQTDILLADAVVTYLRDRATVDPKVEGRITFGSQTGASLAPAVQSTSLPTVAPTSTTPVPPTAPATTLPTATPLPPTATAIAASPTPQPTPGALPSTGASGASASWLGLLGAVCLALGLLARRELAHAA